MNNRQCIMVVDKGRDMQPLLNATLATEGFDTMVVTDDDKTLAMLDRMEPSLIILDSGPEVNDSFRELDRIRRHSNVPIFMLTARLWDEIPAPSLLPRRR